MKSQALVTTSILAFFCCFTISAQVIKQDSLALVALYDATQGDQWTTHTHWKESGTMVSQWYGVTTENNRVIKLELTNNNLTGSLPATVGQLTAITNLTLSANHISGTIPASLGDCKELIGLSIDDNDLTGEIPSSLFELKNIIGIALQSNNLSGQIPSNAGNCYSLQGLFLSDNNLTGNIPTALWQLPYLQYLWIDQNDFAEFTKWPSKPPFFRSLFIGENFFNFEDIEPFMGESIQLFSYSPQAPLYTKDELTVRENAALTLKAQTAGSANHYQWLKDGIQIPSATASDYTWSIKMSDAGNYTAAVTSDKVTALTLQRNPVTVHVLKDTLYRSCNGAAITLQAAVADPGATYQWSNGQNTSSITVNASGKYGVRVETSNYILKDTLEVVIPAKLTLGGDIDTCSPSAQLSANITDADTYQWYTPGGTTTGTPILTAAAPGTYILEIEKAECVQKDTVLVTLSHFIEGRYTMAAGGTPVEDNGIVLTGVPLMFTNTTGTGENFAWSFGDGSTSTEASPLHTYPKAGPYTITLQGTDSRGCAITLTKAIEVRDIFITNAISLNGDGKNDKLYIEPFLYRAALKVINRWGEVVYDAAPYHDDFTGSGLESGVYYYELFFNDVDKRYKGYIHIMK